MVYDEKKEYTILTSADYINWASPTGRGFNLFTDHRNPRFLFYPPAVVLDLFETVIRKLVFGAFCLITCSCRCVHNNSLANILAALFERLGSFRTFSRLFSIPVLPSLSTSNFCWPMLTDLVSMQSSLSSTGSDAVECVDGL